MGFNENQIENKLIVDLNFSRKSPFSFLSYAVLRLKEEENVGEDIFALTPWVMQWSSQIYILDLSVCRKYWNFQMRRIGRQDPYGLFEKILNQVSPQGYTCVFSSHPWSALVLLDYYLQEGKSGLFSIDSVLNQKIYKHISWQNWLAPQERLIHHLEDVRAPQFNASSFRGKQRQLQRFVERMALPLPFSLQQADFVSIQRRFSGWLGHIWRWTFAGEVSDRPAKDLFTWSQQKNSLDHFPWKKFEPSVCPRARRVLEYPVSHWENMEPLLCEDFTKLCSHRSFKNYEKVTSIKWKISLYNLKEMELEISFRHPYSLHQENPHFQTALYQAYYVFWQASQEMKKREEDLDLPEQIPIVSWEVIIRDRMVIKPQILELLNHTESQRHDEDILQLQNKIPLEMESFDLDANFLPEDSYISSSSTSSQDFDYSMRQWVAGAVRRPLFFKSDPVALKEVKEKKFFLERVSSPWWMGRGGGDEERDYFLLEQESEGWAWVYRNRLGEWYQHGLFS